MTWQKDQEEEFTLGDKVLLFNSRVKLFGHGKLWSKWEGPFEVVSSSSHGAVTLRNNEGMLFKVNGQRFKLFLEPNNELEEVDVITFFSIKIYPFPLREPRCQKKVNGWKDVYSYDVTEKSLMKQDEVTVLFSWLCLA